MFQNVTIWIWEIRKYRLWAILTDVCSWTQLSFDKSVLLIPHAMTHSLHTVYLICQLYDRMWIVPMDPKSVQKIKSTMQVIENNLLLILEPCHVVVVLIFHTVDDTEKSKINKYTCEILRKCSFFFDSHLNHKYLCVNLFHFKPFVQCQRSFYANPIEQCSCFR